MAAFAQRFFEIFTLIESEQPYQGTYDAWLVATSLLIAILAAFVALSVSARIVGAQSQRSRWAWASAGAISMGGGIWAMHFIGMLAFDLPCGVSYDPLGTVLSMIPGTFASGVALYVISRRTKPGPTQLLLGAVLMGAGIGAMHYAGMAAMEPEALLRYRPSLFLLSIGVAVALAFISLSIRFHLREKHASDTLTNLAAAFVMGLAVAGMHYTAMQAAVFYPSDEAELGNWIATNALGLPIAIGAGLIAAFTLITAFAGRQMELATSLGEEAAQRRILEQAAESGRARLQAIFDAVADAIVTIDRGGAIQQWSSGAQRIFGYGAEEVLGRNLTMLMPEPHRSQHHRYVDDFIATRLAKIIGIGRVLTAVRKDGTEFPIELTVSEVRDGSETFFTGIMRDITDRQRAEAELISAREQAESANLAKSQFLATMSHEIRTPMNGVLGMANLLSSTRLSDRQGRLVENLMRSGQALLSIINDILDFSKIEAGRFELFAVPFDPHEVIDGLTDFFSAQCSAKGLEYIYFVADDVPSQLIGDPLRLRQVLINLIGNAVKFTEHGEILVEVTLAHSDESGSALTFSVEDTGVGIKAEQQSKLFQSFHQLDGSMTRSQGGSGLGLAISKQLVELMGGTMSVESLYGKGSRFSFAAHFAPGPKASEGRRAPRHIPGKLRILLVDTNAASAEIISFYLTNWGVKPDVVSTVDQAERSWRDAVEAGVPFDVAIIDAKGLGAACLDLVASLRSHTAQKLPEIILLLGLDNLVADDRFEALGATALLTKPVRPSELFDVLVRIISGTPAPSSLPRFMRRYGYGAHEQFDARILVVEDNAVNQEVVGGFLDNLGCRVVTAPNGKIAVELCTQETFDLVLMDCEMPEMDGLEATRRIREIELLATQATDGRAARKRLPIIAVTAHALGEVRDKCQRAGMDDFLIKPFDEKQIAEAMRRWLTPQPAATTPPQEEVIIDNSVIENLRALDRKRGSSRLQRAVGQFVEIAPPLVATIVEKTATGDADAVWRAAHSLKSSAGALGARQLAVRCSEIEAVARNDGIDAVRPLVASVERDLAQAITGLQALIGPANVGADAK